VGEIVFAFGQSLLALGETVFRLKQLVFGFREVEFRFKEFVCHRDVAERRSKQRHCPIPRSLGVDQQPAF